MNDLAVLPTPSKVFRSLLTATGYRPCLEGKGLGRDVDHLALEERPAGNFDLLENCQAQWLRAIRDDAGADWSNLAESAWNRHSNLLRSLARKADTTGMIQDRARPAIFRMLVIPEISGFVRRVHQELPLLDIRQWWDSPFATWLIAAQQQSSLSAQKLLERLANHVDLDERTLERWQQGNAIGKSLWPYRDTVTPRAARTTTRRGLPEIQAAPRLMPHEGASRQPWSSAKAADTCQSRLGTALALSILQAKLLRQFEIAD